jgi:molecular chaperone GrpE
MMGDENQVETVEELLETPDSEEGGASQSVSAENSAVEDASKADLSDDTDYQAAFMDLRLTYAAKERECESLKAESEEYKNQQEKESLEVQAKISTVTELLSVVDNFERARSFVKPQTEGETALHNSYQGVYKDMVAQLKKIGVAPMRAEGKEFDPNLHEALMSEPTADYPEGTVMQELIRGYMMGDRVIRHARVKVAAPPEDNSPSEG